MEAVEFGDSFAAGAAPGGPKVDEDELTFEVRFFGYPALDDKFRGFLADCYSLCSSTSLPSAEI